MNVLKSKQLHSGYKDFSFFFLQLNAHSTLGLSSLHSKLFANAVVNSIIFKTGNEFNRKGNGYRGSCNTFLNRQSWLHSIPCDKHKKEKKKIIEWRFFKTSQFNWLLIREVQAYHRDWEFLKLNSSLIERNVSIYLCKYF